MQLLEEIWAGNTATRWIVAAATLAAIPVVVRVVDVTLGRQARTGADGPRARWLASLATAVRDPARALIRLAGLWLIVHEVLTLPAWLRPWVEGALYFGLMFACGWIGARLAEAAVDSYLVRAAERGPAQVDGLLRPLFRAAAVGFVWMVVLVLGLDNAGYEVGALLTGLGIGGLALAMASKDLLSDYLGGIYIMINRPFAVGDKILFKDKWAVVLEFGLRATTLRDFDINHKIIVPNGQFTSNAIVNISDHPGSMILMNIRLSLTNDVGRVAHALSLVQEVLQAHPEVRYIWSKLDHFDDYAFTLRIHYDVLEFKQRIRVKSEVNLAIARGFQAHGIKFAALPVRAMQAAAAEPDNAFVG